MAGILTQPPGHPPQAHRQHRRLPGRDIIWHCHGATKCTEAAVRTAMIRAGVADECLDRVKGQRTADNLTAELLARLRTRLPPAERLDIGRRLRGWDAYPEDRAP